MMIDSPGLEGYGAHTSIFYTLKISTTQLKVLNIIGGGYRKALGGGIPVNLTLWVLGQCVTYPHPHAPPPHPLIPLVTTLE